MALAESLDWARQRAQPRQKRYAQRFDELAVAAEALGTEGASLRALVQTLGTLLGC